MPAFWPNFRRLCGPGKRGFGLEFKPVYSSRPWWGSGRNRPCFVGLGVNSADPLRLAQHPFTLFQIEVGLREAEQKQTGGVFGKLAGFSNRLFGGSRGVEDKPLSKGVGGFLRKSYVAMESGHEEQL